MRTAFLLTALLTSGTAFADSYYGGGYSGTWGGYSGTWGTWSGTWYTTDGDADADADTDADADSDADTDGTDTGDTGGDKGGCACSSSTGPIGSAAGLVLALGLVARRRRG